MENRESFVSSLNLLFDLPPTRHSTHGCAFLRRVFFLIHISFASHSEAHSAERSASDSASATSRLPPTENFFLPDALPVEPSNSAAPPIGRTECNLHDGRRSGGGQSSRSLECSKAARNRRYSTSN